MTVLLLTLSLVVPVPLSWWRLRRGPRPWDLIDAALALFHMFWVSSFATAGLSWFMTGQLVPDPQAGLLPSVLGTGAGSGLAALFAVLRARAPGLGLGRPPWGQVALATLWVPPFLALSALWVWLLQALGLPAEEQSLVVFFRDETRAGVILGVLVYAVLVAPLCEELVFRGFLVPAFDRRFGRWPAIVLTALLFGGMHLADPSAVLPLFLLGAMLGWLRLHTRSLWPALSLHVANNAVALALVLTGWSTS